MLTRALSSLKPNVRSLSSSRALQQLLDTSSSSKSSIPPVSKGEKAWCDIYGVDYEQQIHEALQEMPVAVPSAAKVVNYPTALPRNESCED